MKKYTAVFLVFISLLLIGGCSGTAKAPLTVNGTAVDDEVFRYYLDAAFADDSLVSEEQRITYATNQCIRYVAINSTFKEKGLSLSAADNAELSTEVNSLWKLFSAHYEAVGVSRQTYFKIQTNKAYIEKLRIALYDTDGSEPIAEEELKNYFAANYAAVKLIREYLFTYNVYGDTVDYTEDEMQNILDRYNNAAEEIAEGYSIDFAYSAFVREGERDVEQSLETQLVYDGISGYPEDFYTRVTETEVDKASVYMAGDYIYLINRVDVFSDEALYNEKRSACLEAVSEAPLQSEINRMCNAYTSVRRMKVVESDYKEIGKVKNSETK